MIRKLEIADLVDLEKMKFNFPFPDLNNKAYFLQVAVDGKDEDFIGAGALRITTEAYLMLNGEKSRISKARAIQEVFNHFKENLPPFVNDCHVYCPEEKLVNFLVRHFQFRKTPEQPLYWNIYA